MIISDRQPVMIGYTHIVKWIESCFTTDHLKSCQNAITGFEKVHAANPATEQLKHDLDVLWRIRHNSVARMELDAVRYLSASAVIEDPNDTFLGSRNQEVVNNIINCVSQSLQVSREELFSEDRSRPVSDARMICYLLLFNNVKYISKSQIGRIFNRHHSTIIHGLDQAASLLETDREFQQNYLAATSFLITQNTNNEN